MQRILIENAHLLRPGRESLPSAWIGIEGEHFAYVGEKAPEDWRDARRMDASGMIALPGMVNAHTHVGMTVMRGAADDMLLMPWLEQKIWPMIAAMTPEDRAWAARLAFLEMIRGGTTCFADMCVDVEAMAPALQEMGARASLSEALIEAQDPGRKTLRRAAAYAGNSNSRDSRVRFLMGPHAQYTCSNDYLEEVLKLAESYQLGIHVHLSETAGEIASCVQQHGKSPVEVLDDLGLFERPTLAAHGIFMSQEDREILSERGVTVVHNPTSNMKMGAGAMDFQALEDAGVNMALGTDSTASNNRLSMFREMRQAALMQKLVFSDPERLPAERALEMATLGGARALGLEEQIGQVAPGFEADLVLLKLEEPHARPLHSASSQVIYSLDASDVDTVFLAGRCRLRGGEFTDLDADEIFAHCDEIAERIAP
ncbi:MAG: amidohydrolase [Candidatus Krumholzibacteria bacterium]|jgi:5-methylthioadenosine/S-adenosylhomocysteine deaminase|nr:amidohydrolase [Candidatus Krumholzibacteria bacterium]MDP6670120.1 amidohydrolase [Candidatus Krumholzibacteria bacterium]MDP6796963.1 amidohydrolase [Candidatus Krumholzibacteria bacterium]MDP7021118.1 amidohydrolase [Candidatus Krumholzibacteria bacterium]